MIISQCLPQGSPPPGTCKWQPPSVQKEKCAQPTTEAQRWAHAEADGSWLRSWPSMFWGLKLTPFLGSNADRLMVVVDLGAQNIGEVDAQHTCIFTLNAKLIRSNQRATKYPQTTNKNDVPSEISSSLFSFYDVLFFPGMLFVSMTAQGSLLPNPSQLHPNVGQNRAVGNPIPCCHLNIPTAYRILSTIGPVN